eukprot:GFUD01004297.1.p1 GENE.GFUD01004297.1~~GFUD01004297.1.p1  ORF type:complete len:458 (+),score=143.85 GFUD01004297.1:281-1654(+)
MSKVPGVSVVGVGKERSGFPYFGAAKKKKGILLKIAVGVVILAAVLAVLTAFLLTRGSKENLVEFKIYRENLVMSDNIKHVAEVKSVAASNEQFSRKLYDVLKGEEGNLIMSPFSVSGVMAMVSAGAKGNTLQQIRSGLSFPSPTSLQLGYQDTIPALRSTDNFTLEAANTAFAMEGFSLLAQFQEILHRNFHANIQTVDFGDSHRAARMINNWVENMTRDKIKNLIKADMLSALTRLVLVNAIYFKGDWAAKFDPQLTKKQDFSVSPTITVKMPMMMQEREFPWAYLDPLASTMVELPYKGDRIVMQVLLPEDRHGLGELEEKLNNYDVQELFAKASFETKVMVQLPKFKLEQRIPLTEHLITLGMKDMFTEGVADFSGIDGTRQLFISSVVQKAFIEVNEEGSEAAAATGAVLMFRSGAASPRHFVADHPFIFYLRDKTTGMLLFQGRVVNPMQE